MPNVPRLFVVFYFHKGYSKVWNRRINIMISAGHYWKKHKFKMPIVYESFSNLFIDSGGFQLIGKFGEYPFTTDDYVSFVNKISPDYCATLDYPCDGLDRIMPHIKLTNKERIERTVNNSISILDHDVDAKVIPVIQGYSLDEYQYCLDRLKEQGLMRGRMAVGSVCIRKRKQEVKDILRLIRKCTSAKLHVFGLNMVFLHDDEIRTLVDSFDTFAWFFRASRYGAIRAFAGTRFVDLSPSSRVASSRSGAEDPTDSERVYLNLKALIEYYDYLSHRWEQQSVL